MGSLPPTPPLSLVELIMVGFEERGGEGDAGTKLHFVFLSHGKVELDKN